MSGVIKMSRQDSNLNGRYVLNTRPRDDAEELSVELLARGATVEQFPLITLSLREEPPPAGVADFIRQRRPILVFTSANGVRFLCEKLSNHAELAVLVRSCPTVAIGQKTASVAAEEGFRVVFVGDSSPSAEFAKQLLNFLADPAGTSALLCRASAATGELSRHLRAAGMDLLEWSLYDSRCPTPRNEEVEAVAERLRQAGREAIVVLTSALGARHFASLFERFLRSELFRVRVVTIGPKTNDAALALGLNVFASAPSSDVASLVASIEDALAAEA